MQIVLLYHSYTIIKTIAISLGQKHFQLSRLMHAWSVKYSNNILLYHSDIKYTTIINSTTLYKIYHLQSVIVLGALNNFKTISPFIGVTLQTKITLQVQP